MASLGAGQQYHWFKLNGDRVQAGQYGCRWDGNILSIWNIHDKNNLVLTAHWNTIINDATTLAFTSKEEVNTWIEQNFFF